MAVIERSKAVTLVTLPSRRKERHRRGRRSVFVAIIVTVLVVLGLGGGAWSFSSQLVNVDPSTPHYTIKVLALHRGTVELASTSSTRRDGIHGLDWPGGRLILGTVIRVKADRVVRHVIGGTHGLKVGTLVDFDVSPYASPADLGLHYSTVTVPGPLGRLPAWYIPGQRSTWVVLVHGWRANRADVLKVVPALARLHLPMLVVTYRNDVAAPASSDHLYHLGATEWQDLQADVRYALSHGARDIILYGFSMGGNIVESFLHDSTLAGRVRAAVLDSPALDWSAVVDWHASQSDLPDLLKDVEVPLVKQFIAWRIGLWSLDDVNRLRDPGNLGVRTLIFHGTDDTVVPVSTSAQFARTRPRLVTLYRVQGAEHTQSWNVGPTVYEARLSTFLRRALQ